MPPLIPAGASARPAARTRASASAKSVAPRKKSAPRKKPASPKPKPRTNSAHYEPASRKKPAMPRRTIAPRKVVARAIRQPPPPREADPSAERLGRRRNYYTGEFLAEAKRRIETTLQSIASIAADLGMDKSVLWRLVRSQGWVRPEGALRMRTLSPVLRLAAQADALVASPTPGGGRSTAQRSGGGESRSEQSHPTPDGLRPSDPPPPGEGGTAPAAPPLLDNAAIDRLEAAVLKELATVETMRASLGAEPLRPADAERTARTLSVLTETLSKLRRLRLAAQPQQDATHDDMPADIDEFRNEFARRLRAFVASRTGGGGAAPAGSANGSDPV